MNRKRHTPDGIIEKLREPANLLAGGCGVEAACIRFFAGLSTSRG